MRLTGHRCGGIWDKGKWRFFCLSTTVIVTVLVKTDVLCMVPVTVVVRVFVVVLVEVPVQER
jgi:hypothetical protein